MGIMCNPSRGFEAGSHAAMYAAPGGGTLARFVSITGFGQFHLAKVEKKMCSSVAEECSWRYCLGSFAGSDEDEEEHGSDSVIAEDGLSYMQKTHATIMARLIPPRKPSTLE